MNLYGEWNGEGISAMDEMDEYEEWCHLTWGFGV